MSPSIPSTAASAASLDRDVERLGTALANRFADGAFGTRRGGFEHHSRVLRQAKGRALELKMRGA